MAAHPPLLVVDAANVVGSVPDGWWRDRAAATTRLRDHLVGLAAEGLRGSGVPLELQTGPLEVVLVVEGQARRVASVDAVRVVAAPASGDDEIVRVVEQRSRDQVCYVASADRELGERVRALGAEIIGPKRVRNRRV